MKLLLILIMAGVILFDFCESSFWEHNHKPGPGLHRVQQATRDRPRPLRHHRHIQAHNYHRPIPRMQRPMPPPGHRRRSPRPPPRHGPIKSYRPPINSNQGSMFLQPMNKNPPRQPQRQHFSGPPALFQQDEIINEQSAHFPTTLHLKEPNTSPSYQRTTEMQPHGYLSSTYKGWKPIVKPFQDSYLRPNKPNGKDEYSRKPEFKVGPQPHNSIDNVRSNAVHTNLNLNTLFRENTERMKMGNILPEYSEHQGIRVPLPPEMGSPIRIPQSFFMDTPWNTQFQSQSEEIPVIKKPFPKFHPKLKNTINSPAPLPNENEETRPNISKFKFNRPRPRPLQQKEPGHGNQPENSGIPKSPIPQFTQQSEEISNAPTDQTPLNLKAKLNSRGRVRVRTKVVKPYSQESEEQGLPTPIPLQPFDPSRIPAERQNVENSGGQPGPGSSYSQHQNNRGRYNNGLVNKGRNNTELSSYPERSNSEGNHVERNHPERNHPERNGPERTHQDRDHQERNQQERDHSERNQQERNQPDRGHPESGKRTPQPEFYERPIANSQFHKHVRGTPQAGESELKSDVGEQKNAGGGRRRRPKDGHKNVAVQQQTTVNNEGPAFLDDFYFPPGFSSDLSKNTDQHPVSFMTMPGSKPQVIHHTYESPQTQQQLYPINVIRSPESEYQRPNHGHGTIPNRNYVQNNRPRFVIMNSQNGAGPSHPENFRNQHNMAAAYPSNHESTYSPHAFGSNISPYTLGPSHPPPQNRHQMPYPRPSPTTPRYAPPRVSPSPATTLRNPYFQSSSSHTHPVPYEMSPTMTSYEVSESSEVNPYQSSPAYARSTSPNSFPLTSPRTIYPPPPRIQQQRIQPQPTKAFGQYTPNFGSAEYDKIPMQYADQLRPILRDEPVQFSSTTPNGRYIPQSPAVQPPPNFFTDFFKPFDQTFNGNPDQDLEQKPSVPVRNQIRPPFTNMGFEPYKSQSSSNIQVVPHPVTGSSFQHTTDTSRPFSYSPQLYDGPMLPSASSTHKMDFDEINYHPSNSWSKLKDDESAGSSTENVIPTTTMQQTKKHGNKVNQLKPQYSRSSSKSEVESTRTVSKSPYGEIEHDVIEDTAAVTTYKPSVSSSSKKTDSNLANEGNIRRDRVSDSDSNLHLEDDLSDSNTPRSVRVRGKADSSPARLTTESPEDSITSTTFKSRRQFRRRRPESLVRRRYFSSRVKPDADSEEEKVDATTQKPQASNRFHRIQESEATVQNDDGHEPSRISGIRHRRLFQRRKIPISSEPLREPEKKAAPSTSTPTSTESEPVTYGESQWFRIKPADSSEEPPHHVVNNKQDHVNQKLSWKPHSDKGQYKSKLGSPIQLLPLESTTTEHSGEELSRSPFPPKHSGPLKDNRKIVSNKDGPSKRSM